MSTPHADANPPGQAAVDQGVDSVDFDLAVLGRGLPAQVEDWLAEAGRLGPHEPKAAVLIQQARQAAPNHPATLIALYRYHFYGHGLNEALDVAQDALALARSALQPPVQDDPGALPLITDDQARFDAVARFYLFTLKGYAYLHLRLGHIGPGLLDLIPDVPVPSTPEALVALMTAKVTVPHKIRNRLTQAAQYIENFKHRKSVVQQMNEAFKVVPTPSPFHLWLAGMAPPMIVESWYDDTLTAAMKQVCAADAWGEAQGLAQSEHFGTWWASYNSEGQLADAPANSWKTLVYRPIGGHLPASNYLVSDSDYVEVLTEIDIQTPIPELVQQLRTGRHFLFLGCRFNDQITRIALPLAEVCEALMRA